MLHVPWLQRHRLVYMGFVQCGGTFQMPTHYGTNGNVSSHSKHGTNIGYVLDAIFMNVEMPNKLHSKISIS